MGWFSIRSLSDLLPILLLIINSLVSISERKKLILYWEKKNLMNKNNLDILTDEEFEGKLVSQKIAIYFFIILLSLIIRITESTNFSLYTYYLMTSIHIKDAPMYVKYFCKGVDRIFILLFSMIFLLANKKTSKFLKTIL